jgi:hypothetical protein
LSFNPKSQIQNPKSRYDTFVKTLLPLPLLFLCFAAAPATQPVPARLGVNIHFTKPQPGEIKMMADAGVNIVRMDFAWAGTEREKGKYDFSAYDGLMAALEEYKIGAVFILDYSNKFYDDGLSPHTDAGREAFAKWAAAAVTHFKGRDIVWEMYNEPNIQFWKPKPNVDDYTKLAIATGKAIYAVDLQATYVGPASSTIDLPFLEACFKAGCLGQWKAVSVHPYRQSEPETVAKEYRELRRLIRKYSSAAFPEFVQPIFSGEWGYSAVSNNLDEQKQALYLPRQWLTNIMNDVPLSIWYDWHDDGHDPKEAEHHFGTVQNEKNNEGAEPWKPKPAYLAMKTFGEQLRGLQFNKRLAAGDYDRDFVLLFADVPHEHRASAIRIVVWTTAAPHDLTVSGLAGRFSLCDHLGKSTGQIESRSTAGGSEVTIHVSQSVTYLAPDKMNDSLRVAAAFNRVHLDEYGSHRASDAMLSAYNPLDRPIRVASVPPTQDPVTVAAHSSKSILIPWHSSCLDEVRTDRVSLRIDGIGVLSQWAHVIFEDSVHLELLGSVEGKAIVRVTDLKGTANDLQVVIGVPGQWPIRDEVQFKPEGRIATVPTSMPLPVRQTRELRIGVSVPPQTEDQFLPTRAFTLLDDLQQAQGEYRVVPDGDKKVKSEQSLASAFPREGPLARGINALELSYHFDPGHKFIQIMPTKDELRPLPGKPRELRLWIYGDASGHLARCRVIDSTGQTFQPNGTKITWSGWKQVTFPFIANECGHWGGKNDGEIHYPLKLDTLFLLDNASKHASEGKVYITSPMTVE